MKSRCNSFWLSAIAVLCCLWAPNSMATKACHGEFPDLAEDICWECIFPITFASQEFDPSGEDMDDTGDHPFPICICPAPYPKYYDIGIAITFWEPNRLAEVMRTPFCSPTLDGEEMGGDSEDSDIRIGDNRHSAEQKDAFRHLHWFDFPLLTWIGYVADELCENGGDSNEFDLIMMSEYEPTWNSDEKAATFAPDSVLFANLAAQSACVADCIAATADFGFKSLYWCAGCQGSLVPMSGNVVNHVSGIESSLLLVYRMNHLLHRMFLAKDFNSNSAICEPQTEYIMNKNSYKSQMVYPRAYTKKAQPYGRSTTTWASNREYPIKGEDSSYLIWRRRVCCITGSSDD